MRVPSEGQPCVAPDGSLWWVVGLKAMNHVGLMVLVAPYGQRRGRTSQLSVAQWRTHFSAPQPPE